MLKQLNLKRVLKYTNNSTVDNSFTFLKNDFRFNATSVEVIDACYI